MLLATMPPHLLTLEIVKETSSMLYLYVKTHNKTGLKYLGKTNQKDYHSYTGSGVYWIRHLEKYGYDYATEILLETENKEELKETGLFFSRLFDVVKSKEWANLQEEKGDGVTSEYATQENYRRLEKGIHPFCDPLHNQKTNKKRQETKRKNGTHNFLGGDIQRNRVENGTHHLLGGNLQQKNMRRVVEEGRHNMMQGNVLVVDKNGIITFMPKKEYMTQTELVHPNSKEGKIRLDKSLEVSEKQRKYLNAKIQCPYCNKEGNISNMKRWHFDKCKMNIGK